MGILLIIPYPSELAELGGAGWVDTRLRRLLRSLDADMQVVSITSGGASSPEVPVIGRAPITVRGRGGPLIRTAARMMSRNEPYLAAKFLAFEDWASVRMKLGRLAAGRTVVTSGWLPLLYAARAGLEIGLHIAHNAEWMVVNEHAPLPLRLIREARRQQRFELRLLARSRRLVALSRLDQRRFEEEGVVAHHLHLPLEHHDQPLSGPGALGFLGTATWPPNAHAITTLVNDVLPRLRSRHPDAHLFLAGRGTENYRGLPAVTACGPVENVAEFYSRVGMVVVPRLGPSTGISVKVLEATEYGVPAIVPRPLSEALAENGPWPTADDVDAIVEVATQLIDGLPVRDAIRNYRDRCTASGALEQLHELLDA